MPVVILLADGVRPDTLASALDSSALPALSRLRAEGGLYTVPTCFPSVTGPAYTPFLMGRFPGPIGLPGLRWYDRSHVVCSFPDYARSYVGYQMGAVDRDIDADAPTIFELCENGLGALNVISRGLAKQNRLGSLGPRSALRAARTHFSGNVRGWLEIDREIAGGVARRIREQRPEFVFAALTGVDKVSHARGHESPMVLEALQIVNGAAAEIRSDAEEGGYWEQLSLWVASDHGHSPVRQHEDLERFVGSLGHRVIAHPWIVGINPEVAVMVSGNAMAHLYVDLRDRERRGWSALSGRWRELATTLLTRDSVDLLLLPMSEAVEVRARGRGTAVVRVDSGSFDYERATGDPLGIGADLRGVTADEALEVTFATDYPDSVVQIAHLATAPRSGDIILSAARDWDFRARYEPIPHVSSHGALHREHMLVPLLLNREPARRPSRTVDVMPSALAALGRPIAAGLDGRSFL